MAEALQDMTFHQTGCALAPTSTVAKGPLARTAGHSGEGGQFWLGRHELGFRIRGNCRGHIGPAPYGSGPASTVIIRSGSRWRRRAALTWAAVSASTRPG